MDINGKIIDANFFNVKRLIMENFFVDKYKISKGKVTLGEGKDSVTLSEGEFLIRLSEVVGEIFDHYLPGILGPEYNENNKYIPKRRNIDYGGSLDEILGLDPKKQVEFSATIPLIYFAKTVYNVYNHFRGNIANEFVSTCVNFWNNDVRAKLRDEDFHEMMFHLLDGRMERITLIDENHNKLEDEQYKTAIKSMTPTYLEKATAVGNFVGKKDFNKQKARYMLLIVKDEKLCKALLDEKFITDEDIATCVSQDYLLKQIMESNCLYLIKYLDIDNTIIAYRAGLCKIKELTKFNISELFQVVTSYFWSNEMIDFIMKVKKYFEAGALQTEIWKLFESDYFNLKDINKLNSEGLINTEGLIRQYIKNQKRPIKAEFDGKISDSKLYSYMDIDKVMGVLSGTHNSLKEFIATKLKEIYASNDDVLDEQIIAYLKEHKDSKIEYIDLYKNGIVDLKYFDEGMISEEELTDLYYDTRNPNVLVDGFNVGVFEAITVYELVNMDDSALCSLVSNNGLSSKILTELFTVYEILTFCAEEKIAIHNLKGADISIEEIKELYKDMKLPLILLDDLEKAGVFSEEQVKKIKDSYDIKSDYEKLVEFGIVEGLDDIQRERELNPIDFSSDGTIIDDTNMRKRKVHCKAVLPDKIGLKPREDLLKLLGADDKVLPISGELFEDYYLYTLVDKGIAVIEPQGGRELTFVMPLRMVLEQVNGNGKKGILATAHYKRLLMENKNIRNVKHTARYGTSLIEAVCDLSEDFKLTKPLRDEKYKSVVGKISSNYKSFKKDEKEK